LRGSESHYIYDDNGNMTQKSIAGQNINYIYNEEDRLTQIQNPQSEIYNYYYDPFGRRLWKEVDGTRTYFLYSDEGLIGEYDASGSEIRAYGYAPDSIWTTDPLFQKIGDYYYFYQNDHLGTPQKLIGTNGLVVWAGVYDSFGNCQVEVEGITNNLRFPGQYYDAKTGLHYNWLRYYDPGTGRYLSTDPFGDGLNLYAYCFNNPYYWIDPLGLCSVSTNTTTTINVEIIASHIYGETSGI
jgi:RHS repeat-associated protein